MISQDFLSRLKRVYKKPHIAEICLKRKLIDEKLTAVGHLEPLSITYSNHDQLLSLEYCCVKETRWKHKQSKLSEIRSERKENMTKLKAAVRRTHQVLFMSGVQLETKLKMELEGLQLL